MSIKSIYTFFGVMVLMAAVVYSVFSFSDRDAPAQADESRQVNTSEGEPESGTLSGNLVEINRQNQVFRDQYPEIVGDSEPRECKPGDLWFTCSEVYGHRFDPRLQKRYGEEGYTESFVQCGEQRDYWRTDGQHPDGEQVVVFLECDGGEFIGPSPTPALQ